MRASVLLGAFACAASVSALRGHLHNDYAFYAQGDDAPYTAQWELNPEHVENRPPPGPPPGPPPKKPGHGLPHFPGKPKEPNGTVYTVLSESPFFSRFFKAVNFSDEIVSLLNDSTKSVTIFALPNHAIPKPPPHRKEIEELHIGDWLSSDLELPELLSHIEALDADADKPSKEHLKKIVTAILSYHILPEKHSFKDLTANVTHGTHLSNVFGGLNDEPLRLRIGRSFPIGLTINAFSRVVGFPVPATNGIIYGVNHPLLPPPSAFQEFFLLQRAFSTLTSALQRTGLTDLIDYRLVRDAKTKQVSTEGAPVVTVFAPSNAAFEKLPPKLKFFLFSPFGENVLKKILQYHIVPTTAIHSDWLLNTTSDFSVNEFNIADLDPSCMQEFMDVGGKYWAHPEDEEEQWSSGDAKLNKATNRNFARGRHASNKRSPYSQFDEARKSAKEDYNSESYWQESAPSPPEYEGYNGYNDDPYYNSYNTYNHGPNNVRPPPHFCGPPPPPPPHFDGPHFDGPPPPHLYGPPPPHFYGPHPPPPHFYGPHPPPPPPFFHGPPPPPPPPPPSPPFCHGPPPPSPPPPFFHGPPPPPPPPPPSPPFCHGPPPPSPPPPFFHGPPPPPPPPPHFPFNRAGPPFGGPHHPPPHEPWGPPPCGAHSSPPTPPPFYSEGHWETGSRSPPPQSSPHGYCAPPHPGPVGPPPFEHEDPHRYPPPPPHFPGGGGPHRSPPPGQKPKLPHFPKVELAANYTVSTALPGRSLNVLVVKIPIIPPGHKGELAHITKVVVNGQVVKFNDGVALNGAIHAVDKLVSPRRKTPPGAPHRGPPGAEEVYGAFMEEDFVEEEEVDDWEDWEDWLLEWASQA